MVGGSGPSPRTEPQTAEIFCECCFREGHRGDDGWVLDGHGFDFCPECAAAWLAELAKMVAALPARIGLCPSCAPEFYYPLAAGENLICPTPDCGQTMVVYERSGAV